MDGRKEKRNHKALLAMLSSGTRPLTLMLASTENVSSRGMRVQTDRPWKPDTRLLVETSESERSARARVIYCETLANTTFAVGLEFLNSRSSSVSFRKSR
jgi:PilZ domain